MIEYRVVKFSDPAELESVLNQYAEWKWAIHEIHSHRPTGESYATGFVVFTFKTETN